MVPERLTEEELAARLSEVLERVIRGERFQIESDGEVFAEIAPPISRSGTTWAEFIAKADDLRMPDESLADDLEDIQTSQGVAELQERLTDS